jgi:hypothetical protein
MPTFRGFRDSIQIDANPDTSSRRDDLAALPYTWWPEGEPMLTKCCSKCGDELPLVAFHFKKASMMGVRIGVCCCCVQAQNRARKAKNRTALGHRMGRTMPCCERTEQIKRLCADALGERKQEDVDVDELAAILRRACETVDGMAQ